VLTAVDLVQRGIETKPAEHLFQYRLSVNFLLRRHFLLSRKGTLKRYASKQPVLNGLSLLQTLMTASAVNKKPAPER